MCFPINNQSIAVRFGAIFAIGLLWSAQALAALQLQTEALQGPAWRVENLNLELGPKSLLLRADRFIVQGVGFAEQIRWHCPQADFTSGLQCDQAELSAVLAGKPLQGTMVLTYRQKAREFLIESQDLQWGNNQMAISVHGSDQNWRVEANIQQLQLADLMRILPKPTDVMQSLNGQFTGNIQLSGDQNGLEHIRWRLSQSAFSFSSEDGRYAGEQLAGGFKGRWQRSGKSQFDLTLNKGQLLLDPLFWDFDPIQTVSLSAAGTIKNAQNIRLDKIELAHPGVGHVSAQAALDLSASQPLRSARIQLSPTALERFAEPYIKPFLTATAFSDLTLGGQAGATANLEQGRLSSIDAEFANVDIALPDERLSLQGLSGRLVLGQSGPSRLSWRSGKMTRLALGAADISLVFQDNSLTLSEPTRIPVLDGVLHIDHLSAEHLLGGGGPVWRLSGRLEPISMPALSTALDWPELAGRLGGTIPGAVYQGQELQVAGTLTVEAFDGIISIHKLRLAQPFGTTPELFADVDIDRLDLEQLTRTFDFGKIEGKLNGWIRDLHLQDWQPVAFDARFFSPEEDDSRRRISQRAVESISALGSGGATAALSRGFLGLFEEFRYRRLGIGCRLERGICQMVGIGHVPGTEGGFYLVEGSGLPRIDVIAYNRIVDWRDLVARLQAAVQSEGPVVK